MSSTTTTSSSIPWPIRPYTPRPWTYTASDFARQDPRPDASFYRDPRFVTHIDDAAIAGLRAYYDTTLPARGTIVDVCASWVSHYPARIEKAAAAAQEGAGALRVVGVGMNAAEMEANAVLNAGRLVRDLNVDADVGGMLVEAGVVDAGGEAEGGRKVDAATCVVSIDYLTRPVEVLRSLRGVTRKGSGSVHLVVSNRCFPTKAIARWLRVDEEERLQMVGDFLHHAGWSKIEIVELSNGKMEVGGADGQQGQLQNALASMLGMGRQDPLWVVRAVHE